MRTSERLKQANEMLAQARKHALIARQRLIYGEREQRVLEALNASIRALEGKTRADEIIAAHFPTYLK